MSFSIGALTVKRDPLELAFSTLRSKEKALIVRLKTTEAELDKVRTAINALRPLMSLTPTESPSGPSTHQEFSLSLDDYSERETDGQEPGSPFAGLRFSQALHKFLLDKPPSTTTEIARGFEMAGWRFKSQNPNAQVNQVGVTLRRFEGRLFREFEDSKRWIALEAPML